MRLSGAAALLLFLLPTFFVVKFYALDQPRALSRANQPLSPSAKAALMASHDPDAMLQQAHLLRHDPDPVWRSAAASALETSVQMPGRGWQRPLETLTAKASLAEAAAQDTDANVRATASAALHEIARHGAVIRR